ncbi:MAG: sulfatase-like hydrolase/transferase, partial [Verrucomicrobiae bacterium]|nr:sulfatase-like hydrolase/transferase [Verrucomicrobiae bacterium]
AVMDWEGDYFPGPDGKYFGVDDPVNHASAKVQGVWGPERPGDEYLTDRLGRHAVEFIEKNKGGPFFLYLAFNAVHTPLHAKRSDRARFAHIKEEPLQMYAAMVVSMDENVGRVLDALKANGIEENTLVAFTSDNGPALGGTRIKVWRDGWPPEILLGSAGPLNGHKAQFLEGGFRQPYILRWPARLKAGITYSCPVSTMDLYPTFCAAAAAPVPDGTRLDGVNLLPFLTGQDTADPHKILFWKNGDSGAVREGDWKLLLGPSEPRVQLFNLHDDIGESRDLAGEKPDVAARLRKTWDEWSASLPPRANPPRPTVVEAEPKTITGKLSFRQPLNRDGKPYKAYDVTTEKGQVYTFTGMIAKQGAPAVDVASLVGHRVRVAGKCTKAQAGHALVEITALEDLGP